MSIASATRDRIVAAADDLFYRRGFAAASFADIAAAVGISRGNFYHHFKTKDEILSAVVEKRLADRRRMLERWRAEGDDAKARIVSFIAILIVNQDKILRFGCPLGTLTTELAKLEHGAQDDAARLFALFKAWLVERFEELGREEDAETLAMRLLARSQGVATLASALNDPAFIEREVEDMTRWLDDLAAPTARPAPSAD